MHAHNIETSNGSALRSELLSLKAGFLKTGDYFYVPMGFIIVEKTMNESSVALRTGRCWIARMVDNPIFTDVATGWQV